MSYIESNVVQAGNGRIQPPLLRICYNDRRALTASPAEYAALDTAVRRLFAIPVDHALILSTEVSEFGDDRLEIDPEMWNLIKSRINTIWIQATESSGSQLPVFIQVPGTNMVRMLVITSDTISSLTSRIRSSGEVACQFDPRLLVAGRIQGPARTIADCGTRAGDIIYCVDDTGIPIQIYIKEMTGRNHTLEVKTSWTIEHVKSVLEFITGTPMEQQRIGFASRRLEASQTLSQCGLMDRSTVYLVLVLRGGKPVIYLFSPNLIDANLSLRLHPSWSFSALYPVTKIQGEQDGGQLVSWNVLVNPDGTLKHKDSGSDVSYLYWEAKTNPVQKLISPPSSRPGSPNGLIDPNESQEIFDPAYPIITSANSVVLAIADLPLYLDKSLLALGLHTEARTSFITYWLPDLLHHEYIALRFLPQYAYEAAAPLTVEPTPLEVVRIFMLWKGLLPCEIEEEDGWKEAQGRAESMDVIEWRTIVGLRTGTSTAGLRVLEWGGMEVK